MTREEIMALPKRELEIAVGRDVMGYSPVYYKDDVHEFWILATQDNRPASYPNLAMRMSEASALIDTPRYTEDANALRDMEMEIDRKANTYVYFDELASLLGLDVHTQYGYMSFTPFDVAAFLTATLEVKCRAALITLIEQDTSAAIKQDTSAAIKLDTSAANGQQPVSTQSAEKENRIGDMKQELCSRWHGPWKCELIATHSYTSSYIADGTGRKVELTLYVCEKHVTEGAILIDGRRTVDENVTGENVTDENVTGQNVTGGLVKE